MSSVIQVNRIYLIFNPVHFLVDSSDGIVFNKTRKPSGNRLSNGLVMPLLPLGIMPLVNTTTFNPRKETLLHGESSLKPSNEDLIQQMISNEKRLPTIY